MKSWMFHIIAFLLYSSLVLADNKYNDSNNHYTSSSTSLNPLVSKKEYSQTFQDSPAQIRMADLDGISNLNNIQYSSINSDIGKNFFIQAVNSSVAIYDKSGTQIIQPINLNTLWEGFGGVCESENNGHPIVFYDDMADRWLISQSTSTGRQCVAISVSNDPTKHYYLYNFEFHLNSPNTDPELSVGKKAYYLSGTSTNFLKGITIALERDNMLKGLPARQQKFIITELHSVPNQSEPIEIQPEILSIKPLSINGKLLPPDDVEHLFAVVYKDSDVVFGNDEISFYQLDINWNNTANSSLRFKQKVKIPKWVLAKTTKVAQPNGDTLTLNISNTLTDGLGNFSYHGFRERNSITLSHTISQNVAQIFGIPAIRWYEFELDDSNNLNLIQQSNYNPDATKAYWASGIGTDAQRNIALGYSITSPSLHPSIELAKHDNNDPAGSMSFDNQIKRGEGSQQGSTFWDKKSEMKLSPYDDCTFWYSNQYYKAVDDNTTNWSTYISSFKLNNCSTNYTARVNGIVLNSQTGEPIENVLINIGNTTIYSDRRGEFSLSLPAGNYHLRADGFGLNPKMLTNFRLNQDEVKNLSVSMDPVGTRQIWGELRDKITGLPVYGMVSVSGSGGNINHTFSNPEDGTFRVQVPSGNNINVNTNTSEFNGYTPQTTSIDTSGSTPSTPIEFLLEVGSSCNALGYSNQTGQCLPVAGSLKSAYIVNQRNNPENNIKLTDQNGTLLGTSQATPNDKNLDDGFMHVFIPSSASQLKLEGDNITNKIVSESNFSLSNPISVSSLAVDLEEIADIQLTMDKGETQIISVQLSNISQHSVSFSVVENNTWLDVSPTSGIIPANSSSSIRLAINTNSMAVGLTSANIRVNTDNSTQEFAVTVRVNNDDDSGCQQNCGGGGDGSGDLPKRRSGGSLGIISLIALLLLATRRSKLYQVSI